MGFANGITPTRYRSQNRVEETKTAELNNGVKMPILGFGTYQIDDLDVCERSLSEALDTGIG